MHASLNPALDEARFCPRCGGSADVDFPRRIVCPHCGYAAYYNPKPVAGAIPIDDSGRVILLRRGFDPGRGLWTFPGGFVDLGESVQEAARREASEELEIEIEIEDGGRGLVGVYSRAEDRVVLIVYRARALGIPQTTAEAVEVRAFAVDELPWEELAFWSTELALRDAFPSAVRPTRD
jgi:8-oxo-dGTP diphosphatase